MSLADDIEAVFGVRQQLWANGYRPVPIYNQSKKPCGAEWRALARLDPPEATTVQPRPDALGTGVLGGEISGIDIDVLDQGLSDTIRKRAEELFGPTTLVRVGQPPKVLLVYCAATPFAKIATPELFLPGGVKCQVEILGEGQQFVVDGIHPDTQQPYRWIEKYTPYQLPVASLPVVTEEQARTFVADAERILRDAGAKEKPKDKDAIPRPDTPRLGRHDCEDTFFSRVNQAALDDLGLWFRRLFPLARFEPGTGAWRISSKDLGRDLEEDISIHPSGIRDFGEEEPCSAIDLVMRHGGAATAIDAALRLCEWIGRAPEGLGYTPPRITKPRAVEQRHSDDQEIILKSGREFEMQKIDWQWPGWLAAGKFHLLAGAKAAGKSTLAIDLMATTSIGGTWPDGTRAPIGDTLIWSGEDGIEDTILPRFAISGGDLDRIYPIKDVICNGIIRPFDPSKDIPALIRVAERLPNLKVAVIDPIVLAIPSGSDSHKNTETRRGLQPLVEFAEKRGIAIIGITHFTKGTADRDPIERVTGSLAFGALPRCVWGASADEDGFQRRLVRIASNIGPTGGGFEYTLHQELLVDYDISAQRIAWGVKLNGSPADLLNQKKHSAQASAGEFLREFLKGGPIPQRDVKEAAEAHGHTWATVRLAQVQLKIKPRKEAKAWVWELPKNLGILG